MTAGFLMARRASITLMLGLSCATISGATTDIFSTPGTTNWVCPPGVNSITVECWGGGGAGGGSFVDTTNGGAANAGGGSGGGGAYAKLESVAVTPGSSYVVTIPAAATCPSSGFTNNQRYNGSPVSFAGDSQTVTANGGQGGQCRIVTSATASSGSNGAGGAAGTGFDAAFAGGTSAQWGGGNGNGGGGGAGDLGTGGAALASNGSFGAGGTGSDAEHTGGNGGAAKNGAGVGNDAASPGGGGGGAKSTTTSTTSRRGGNGGLGRIILTYTIPPPATKTKANNATNLDQGGSWIGGVAPSSLELAKWDNTVTSANTSNLGADLTWSGVLIVDPAGPVIIGGANTLTVGGAVTDIDMSTATNDLTVNCPIALGNANVWDIATSRTLTIGGAVSGDFPLTLQGSGRLRLGAGDLLPNGSGNGNLTVNGTLDLNGHSETINGLSGTGIVDTTAASTAVTLTTGGNNQSSTFDGILQNSGSSSTLNLVKAGTGTLVLNGQNTLAGNVAITEGTLGLGNTAPIANVAGLTLSGGTMLRSQITGGTVSAPITLGGAATTSTITAPLLPPNNTDATTQKVFSIEGAISGDGDLILAGVNGYNQYGRINLNAQSDYTGSTLITTLSGYNGSPVENSNIFVRLAIENALPVTTVLTLDGGTGTGGGRWCELDLNGNNQTLAGLTNVAGRTLRFQQITNRNATAATLTVNNTAPFTYAARIGAPTQTGLGVAGNNLGLTKTGAGTLTLTGANSYTEASTITGGTLVLGSSTALPATSSVSIGTATLGIGATVNASTTGALNCTGAAIINLGDNTSAVVFGDSSSLTWTGSLQITGGFVSGTSIRFGNGSGDGLSTAQLAQITAAGFTNFGIDASGFLTADTVAGSGFDTWKTTNSATGQTLEGDHDNDGVTNGIEYFIGGPTGNTTGFTPLPGVVMSGGNSSVTFIKAGDYIGGYEVQVSTSLAPGSWSAAPTSLDPNVPGTVRVVGNNVTYTFPAGTKNFVRLAVTGP